MLDAVSGGTRGFGEGTVRAWMARVPEVRVIRQNYLGDLERFPGILWWG